MEEETGIREIIVETMTEVEIVRIVAGKLLAMIVEIVILVAIMIEITEAEAAVQAATIHLAGVTTSKGLESNRHLNQKWNLHQNLMTELWSEKLNGEASRRSSTFRDCQLHYQAI